MNVRKTIHTDEVLINLEQDEAEALRALLTTRDDDLDADLVVFGDKLASALELLGIEVSP